MMAPPPDPRLVSDTDRDSRMEAAQRVASRRFKSCRCPIGTPYLSLVEGHNAEVAGSIPAQATAW